MLYFKSMKNIIFDFNGTILNDVNLCLECLNDLIIKHLKKDNIDINTYRSLFTFPVSEYYRRLGFDFKEVSFEELAHEWYDNYQKNEEKVMLYDGIEKILLSNKEKGYRNIILSACEQTMLERILKRFDILKYFDLVLGIDDRLAHGKVDNALKLKELFKDDKNIMIGDTIHDFEVAQLMGIECILVSNGYQSYEVLKAVPTKIISDIRELEL